MSATIADGSTSDGAVWKLYLPLRLEHCSWRELQPELQRPSLKVSLAQTPLQSERPCTVRRGTLTVCTVGCVFGCWQSGCNAGDAAGGTADVI